MNIAQEKMIVESLPSLYPLQGYEEEAIKAVIGSISSNHENDVPDTNVGNTISRQAALDALNHELRCGAVINQCGLEVAYEVIEGLPPEQPVIVPCNYVKACNEATMDKLTSAVLYLNALEELKKHGYVLVDMRKVER